MTVPVAAAVAARPPGRPWPGSADLSGPRTGSGSPGRVRVQDGREPEARSKIQNGQHKKTVAVTDSKPGHSLWHRDGSRVCRPSRDRAQSSPMAAILRSRSEPLGGNLARDWPGPGPERAWAQGGGNLPASSAGSAAAALTVRLGLGPWLSRFQVPSGSAAFSEELSSSNGPIECS